MSQPTEQVEESSETVGSVLDILEDWYHVPALTLILSFMVWVRVQSLDRFTQGGEVMFSGADAWYHLRQVTYTVQNWPQTMPYDPWTYFPFGTSVGQFGTLYDQLVATAALVVGLGDPSQQTVGMTLVVAPAIFGSLVVLPTYFIGKRLGGRGAGLFGALVLALLPGTFLRRGLVGFADHNIAEPLFQGLAVLAMMVALTAGEREKPVYELVVDRDFAALRTPFGWSVLAGIATALYLWTWPPGVLLVGVFGVFYTLKLTADYVRGVSPDHVAFVGATSMTVTGLLMLVPLGMAGFNPVRFSLLQPLLAFAVAGGVVFMAWLARQWDARNLAATLYPTTVFGLIGAAAGFTAVFLPDLFGLFKTNLIRFVGFSAGAQTRTIGEAQPFLSNVDPSVGIQWYDIIIREYGLMLFTAGLAAFWMVWRAYRTDDHRAEQLLVLVWTVFITAAAFTQVRFNYYLAVPVAVLNAYLVGEVLRVVNLRGQPRKVFGSIEGYQVMALLFVVILVMPVLVVPAQIGQSGQQAVKSDTAVQQGASAFPGEISQWDGTLDWMRTNTPAEGTYGGADNEMAYYGTFTEGDGDYDYPEGAYGVMSWWDYGHLITVEGERIPNANPFQEGATTAANYLLAPSEQRANGVIQQLGDDGEDTRYVAVDWKMVEARGRAGNAKFSAPTVFNDNVSAGDFYAPVVDTQTGRYFYRFDQRYYQSQMIRLYKFHGSAVEPRPVVVDWEQGRQYDLYPQGPNESVVRTFRTMEEARNYVANDSTAQIGGVGPFPSERVPALEHYRLVRESNASALDSRSHTRVVQQRAQLLSQAGVSPQALFQTNPSWVKLFERVDGATVEGTGPANTTVTASVQMRSPASGSAFTYRQQAQTGPDGEFTMTLPYSTTGYEEWGTDEGYTNVSTRATGPYTFQTPQQTSQQAGGFVSWNATAQVSEGKVVGEDDSPVTVDLERQVQQADGANDSATNESVTNETATENSTVTNETATNTSAVSGPSAPTVEQTAASVTGDGAIAAVASRVTP